MELTKKLQILLENKQLHIIEEEVDPYLEMAEIQRQCHAESGPALWFKNIKGCSYSAVSNLFGSQERLSLLFGKSFPALKTLIELKKDPAYAFANPLELARLPGAALNLLPKKISPTPSVWEEKKIEDLPQIVSWPEDGGAFVTLPQVYTESPSKPGWKNSNMGMYRIQLSGGEYIANQEIGLHYQIHRGIGLHHAEALEKAEELKVSVFVGGPPAHTMAAVMPLPEGLSELSFAGALNGNRFRYYYEDGFLISADADFCILGTISLKDLKPEGPFGDHLGYYSLKHAFPFLKVHKVLCKPKGIWLFTVVGRPPQEDSYFGSFIHQLTSPLISKEIPGVKEVHAVDEAGVHPLMLAIAKERYVPYEKRRPMEILRAANAVLGYGQCSLTKYLWIAAAEDNPSLSTHNLKEYFQHVLERIDFKKDLHFQTQTTIDTLDYTGHGLNQGSKLILAAAGEPIRSLGQKEDVTIKLSGGFTGPYFVMPGVLSVTGPKYVDANASASDLTSLSREFESWEKRDHFPLIVLSDDGEFAAQNLANFLWVCFTRSDPAQDVDGLNSKIINKHWSCESPLIIDARTKPHHAPALVSDENTGQKVKDFWLPKILRK